jgi:hypothetical protein
MNISDLLKSLPKRSKKDDIPGTVEAYLDELCPACGGKLKLMKPCCSNPRKSKVCVCGWTQYLE